MQRPNILSEEAETLHSRIAAAQASRALPTLGTLDLIFADAAGGKWTGLSTTIAALRSGGILLVDDVDPTRATHPDQRRSLDSVRTTLTTHPDLLTADLPAAGGIILATRRR